MASWKKGRGGRANANIAQREGAENKVSIARMSQNLSVATVCGIVIAKQSPRTVAPNAQTGEDRCVLNFTLRDTEVDTINVACWGDCTQVKQLCALFRVGDCVQIANVLVKSRNTGTASDSFAPKVSSPYQLVANVSRDDKCELKIADEALFCQMMPLLHVPLASVSDVTPIADVMYCGRQMADEHINMLVGVKRVGPATTVSTRDGRQTQKVEVSVLDQSCLDFKVILWDEELVHLSQLWREKETVLFIADIRVKFNQFFGMAGSTDTRTVITTNPDVPEAQALFEYLQSVDLTGEQTGQANLDGTVYTAKQINEELASRLQSGNAMPFGGILFALLTCFDLDGPGTRLTTFRCGHCNFRVKSDADCLNENCPVNRGEAEAELMEEYDIPVQWRDHTGSVVRSRIAGAAAARFLGVPVEDLVTMSDDELTRLKWKFLLERHKVHFKVNFGLVAKGRDPVLTVVSCEPASPKEYLEKVFLYY